MPKQPITIGEREFPSKKAALKHYQAILNEGKVGRTLDEGEFRDVVDLLAVHPRAAGKTGVGAAAFSIGLNDYRGRCFMVHRADGSRDEVSFTKAINGDPKPFAEFSGACRRVIGPGVHAWKLTRIQGNRLTCEVTGESLAFDDADVDHYKPYFAQIVRAFLDAHAINEAEVEYIREGRSGAAFADEQLAAAFDEWHDQQANLRIIKSSLNLATSHLARVTPTARDGQL